MLKQFINLVKLSSTGTLGVSPQKMCAPSVVLARGTPGVSPQKICDPSVEQRAALLAGQRIVYTLKRSRKRRTIGLRIDDRGLTLSVPLRASERCLQDVLQGRANWVIEKLAGWAARKPVVLRYVEGELIPYLGETLTLRLGASRLYRNGADLWLQDGVLSPEMQLTKWYRQQALPLFTARVALYAALLNVSPSAIKLSTAKTRWGSCSSTGTIRLNLQLIKLPQHLIDYVVVHELAHLREMNHSVAYWRVVASVFPDFAEFRRELKALGLR